MVRAESMNGAGCGSRSGTTSVPVVAEESAADVKSIGILLPCAAAKPKTKARTMIMSRFFVTTILNSAAVFCCKLQNLMRIPLAHLAAYEEDAGLAQSQ